MISNSILLEKANLWRLQLAATVTVRLPSTSRLRGEKHGSPQTSEPGRHCSGNGWGAHSCWSQLQFCLTLRPDSSCLRRTTCCKMPSAWRLSLRQHTPQTHALWVCMLLPYTAATYFSVDVIFRCVIFSCHVLPCSYQMKS